MSAGASNEQNKSEAPSPFKLKRAREKGVVARGIDLGFFSTLVALTAFALIAGHDLLQVMAQSMRATLRDISNSGLSAQQALDAIGRTFWPATQAVALLGATVMLVVAFFEVVQVGGIVVSTQPLKPDFKRLNPAEGLKRLFTLRMLKETLKNLVKMAIYATAVYLVVHQAFSVASSSFNDAQGLTTQLRHSGLRLLMTFCAIALAVAAIDQVLTRGEFTKQMRMSRRELTREIKEREGEPRIKQKRRQLHAEFSKQTRSLGDLNGSDMLIVNPEHFAIGLLYDAQNMGAPVVTAKGRNRFALELKRRAHHLNIPVIENPPLARALYKQCDKDREIPADYYRSVADHYMQLARAKAAHA